MIVILIKTTKHSGWLDNYKDGFVRKQMNDTDVEILESALSERRKKYIDNNFLVIEDFYENKISALKVLSKLKKIEKSMLDIGFKVTVDVVEKL